MENIHHFQNLNTIFGAKLLHGEVDNLHFGCPFKIELLRIGVNKKREKQKITYYCRQHNYTGEFYVKFRE